MKGKSPDEFNYNTELKKSISDLKGKLIVATADKENSSFCNFRPSFI